MADRAIRLQSSLSGDLEPLRPRDPGKVSIYACGPTVYDRVHVGNARPFVLFALLKRFLEHEGHEVTLVENVTDVNDKIYEAARERGVPSDALAREMTQAYVEDTDRLGLGRPDHEPLASETIAAIVALIADLIEQGHAYLADGDAYFRVRSFPAYGKLSNRRLEDMSSGEPDDLSGRKEDPLDFALWKAQKEGEDTAWEAPWGRGRPGWHIECSAMAEQLLGLDFDIHGGGADLIFPHHENEIAQTEAARERPLARIWMHNGMVQFGDEKMSKSVGNIRGLAGALDQYGRDALVMYFASGHYRQPLAFSAERLEEARRSVDRVRNLVRALDAAGVEDGAPEGAHPGAEPPEAGPQAAFAARREAFLDALADDFNTARALGELFELVSEGNRRLEAGEPVAGLRATLAELLGLLGLEGLLAAEGGADPDAERLLAEREAARAARDFATADRVRDELASRGYEVRDTATGPRLVRTS